MRVEEPVSKFKIGDLVRKVKGYEFFGTVQSVFQNRKGDKRIVVESNPSAGLMHIFNEEQMELIEGVSYGMETRPTKGPESGPDNTKSDSQ